MSAGLQGDTGVPTLIDWLKKHISKGQVVGMDARLTTVTNLQLYYEPVAAAAGFKLQLVTANPVDAVWNKEGM